MSIQGHRSDEAAPGACKNGCPDCRCRSLESKDHEEPALASDPATRSSGHDLVDALLSVGLPRLIAEAQVGLVQIRSAQAETSLTRSFDEAVA
jgi:hypothetical protein